MKLDAADLQLHLTRNSCTGSFGEFCEICKNTYFAEHYLTTASDYNRINSSEEAISNQRLLAVHAKLTGKSCCRENHRFRKTFTAGR